MTKPEVMAVTLPLIPTRTIYLIPPSAGTCRRCGEACPSCQPPDDARSDP